MIPCPPLELPADRPVLLLDFDGVINVFQCSTAREAQTPAYLPALKLLPGFETWLAQLHRAFYLVWCSDAGALVNVELAEAWGIGPRPCIEPTAEEGPQRQWKALAVGRVFADWPGSLAWIQDGFLTEERAWAAQRLAHSRPTWLVDVTETGLTDRVTADLLAWACEVTR
jgi:hypothetical protein